MKKSTKRITGQDFTFCHNHINVFAIMEASVGTIFDSKNREVWLDERTSQPLERTEKIFFREKLHCDC